MEPGFGSNEARGMPPTDDAVRLTADTPCVECGYNLRTLEPQSRCPECGTAISLTLFDRDLSYLDAAWLRRVQRGLWLMFGGGWCYLVSMVGLLFIADAMAQRDDAEPNGWLATVAIAGSLATLVLVLVGVWLATTQHSAAAVDGFGERWRKTLRVVVIAWPLVLLAQIVLPPGLSELRMFVFVALPAGLIAFAWAGHVVAVARHTGVPNRRLPRWDSWAAKFVTIVAVALSLAGTTVLTQLGVDVILARSLPSLAFIVVLIAFAKLVSAANKHVGEALEWLEEHPDPWAELERKTPRGDGATEPAADA